MGLEEKRMKQHLETEVIPGITAEMGGIYNGETSIDIDWDTFDAKDSIQEIEHQVLGRVLEAVKTLCSDDMAKEAMQESFKSVYVKNLESKDDRLVDFADGKLTLQTTWKDFGSIFTPGDIREKIEAGL